MFTTFTLLVVVGGALRLALNWGLKRRLGFILGVPQALAGTLVVPAGLPEDTRQAVNRALDGIEGIATKLMRPSNQRNSKGCRQD